MTVYSFLSLSGNVKRSENYPNHPKIFLVEFSKKDIVKFDMLNITPRNLRFCLPSLKSAWDLVYTGPNHDVREISRNLIGCLEYRELDKTDKNQWKSRLWIDVLEQQ